MRGTFSGASKTIFASKYSIETSWRDRQGLHAFTPLQSNRETMKSRSEFITSAKVRQVFSRVCSLITLMFKISHISCNCCPKFTYVGDFGEDFSIFYGKTFLKNIFTENIKQVYEILKFPGISQRKLSKFFRKLFSKR